MARTHDFSNLSRDDLLLAVRELIARGRITGAEVRAAPERARRIAALEAELASLRAGGDSARSGRRSAAATRAARNGASKSNAPKPKRKITNTPQRVAAMKRQGQYLGLLSRLKGRNRQTVKALAKKDGVPAALKLASSLVGRGDRAPMRV